MLRVVEQIDTQISAVCAAEGSLDAFGLLAALPRSAASAATAAMVRVPRQVDAQARAVRLTGETLAVALDAEHATVHTAIVACAAVLMIGKQISAKALANAQPFYALLGINLRMIDGYNPFAREHAGADQ